MKFDQLKWKNYIQKLLYPYKEKEFKKKASIVYQILWNLGLIFIIVLVLGTAFAGGVGAGYFASLVKDEPIRSYKDMKKDIYNYEETSELYFANNVYLGKLYSDIEREEVKLKDISPHLIDAVIATEDQYFYEHEGIVPKAILRALLQEVTNSSVQTGGSTLTQQLIKNQILTNEVSFERKAKEILLALRLERFFSKEEILEAYLNVSTFGRNSSGRNIAGVQSAAKGIFGVKASELTLPQAAFIAGLPQSPFGYTPYTNKGEIKNNLEPGITRMKIVLNRMLEDGKISKAQYDHAIAYDITKDFITIHENPIDEYPWVTFEIEDRATNILSVILAKKDGYSEEDLQKNDALKQRYLTLADRDIRQNGYRIHSTINKDIYDAMQDVVAQFEYFGSDRTKKAIDPETKEPITVAEPVETASILIENKSGKIISFVGGRDFNREQTNRATNAIRPNGSTMKPLLVYAPAFELGTLSPGSIIPDVPLYLNPSTPNKVWPRNVNGRYNGLVTARAALSNSYNISTVKAYVDILNARPAQYLEKMGFSSLTEADFINRSTALGGLTNGVTVEENTNAFGTFANNGQFIDAYMIEKITDKEGNIIYQHEVKPVNVFSPQTAYLTYDILRDTISSGTATYLNRSLKFSSDWAGKTGTTQDYKDVWFVGVNPNVSFGVWMGYDTPKPLDKTYRGMAYHNRNLYLWAQLINKTQEIAPELVDPSEPLPRPNGIVSRSFCGITGLLPSKDCADAGLVRTDLFNEKFVPKQGDINLEKGRFVTIGNTKYTALASTPEEFVETDFVLDTDTIQKFFGISTDPSKLTINNQSLDSTLSATRTLKENGKSPSAMSITASGNSLSWGNHPEPDIIGYRVYKNGAKIATIKAGQSLSYQGDPGSYYITAVDIAGQESASSNVIALGQPTTPSQPTPSESAALPEPPNPAQPQTEGETEPTNPAQPQTEGETEPPNPAQPQTEGETEPLVDQSQ
ncbi:transglycosylase domain-containing protein [Niallia sp. XMNu-256]|uniref:transglycosylase domain-containing protein n=1 Tax=Niallia sp. XMNu-256 TaxID=3082444 RepID=UPI0030D15CC7